MIIVKTNCTVLDTYVMSQIKKEFGLTFFYDFLLILAAADSGPKTRMKKLDHLFFVNAQSKCKVDIEVAVVNTFLFLLKNQQLFILLLFLLLLLSSNWCSCCSC